MKKNTLALSALTVASIIVMATSTMAASNNRIVISPNQTTPTVNRHILQMQVAACAVAGTPAEFPDDVAIINRGATTMSAGTRVHWSVPSANRQGDYVLTADLQPNHQVFVNGVLSGGVEAGTTCNASIA